MSMKLAVFFPGIGYHCDKPLLYYSRKMVTELGYKTVTLSYSCHVDNLRENKEKMKEVVDNLYVQTEESLSNVNFADYDEILFVSKSVGTVIASAYAYKNDIKCKQILYTPLEFTFNYPHEKSRAFIGTADPWSDVPKVVDKAGLNKVPISVYSDVNHSLECADTVKNIELLEKVMKETYEFLTVGGQYG